QVDANGNGLKMSTAGLLTKVGTGGLDYASLTNFPAGCTNQAITALSLAPTCATITSAYVDTSIAKTGTDINTSNQVTATHLAAALPYAQGGTNTTTAPVKRIEIAFAANNQGTAASAWSLPASGGMVAFPKTDGTNGTIQGAL